MLKPQEKKDSEISDKGFTDYTKTKFGIFYYNPDDKRLWVPKRIKWTGWLLNMGHRYAWLAVIGLLLLMVLLVYLDSRYDFLP
jgi:uncharacterized membrane protein